MIKKMGFSIILMICCICFISGNSAAAEKITTEDFTYEVNADGTLTMVKGNHQITGEEYHVKSQVEIGGKTYTVTKVSPNVMGSIYADKIYFEEGIKETDLGFVIHATEVFFPSTTKKIAKIPYSKMLNKLKKIAIEKNNPFLCIENNIIYTKNRKKVIQGYVTGKVVLQKGIEEIGENAFSGNPITSVRCPESLKIIRKGAFENCEKLRKVQLSKKVKIIEAKAFNGTSVDKLYLGKHVKVIDGLDTRISGFEKLVIDKKNPYYKSVDNVIYTKNGKTLLNGKLANGTVFVPKEVTKVVANAFAENLALTGVVFQGELSSLPKRCFASSGIEFIKLPKNLKKIGTSCFRNCKDIEEIKLPSTLLYIYPSAFEGCMLTKLTIPKNVKRIEKDALYYSIRKLTFKGSKPPRIKKQKEVLPEEPPNSEDGDDNPYRKVNKNPGIKEVIVPKKSVAKYDKIFDKTLKFEVLDW